MTTSSPNALIAACLREVQKAWKADHSGFCIMLNQRASELEASAPAEVPFDQLPTSEAMFERLTGRKPAEPQYKPCVAYPLPVPEVVLKMRQSKSQLYHGKINSNGHTEWGNIKTMSDTHWCFVELPKIEAAPEPKYRSLLPGELVEAGDEYKMHGTSDWVQFTHQPAGREQAHPAHDPLALSEGDEAWVDQQWETFSIGPNDTWGMECAKGHLREAIARGKGCRP